MTASAQKTASPVRPRERRVEPARELTPARFGVPAAVGEVLESPGEPLDGEVRGAMESRFRHDFSNVRVHSDARAANAAASLNARAFTAGSRIVLGAGEREPALLAHELAHTLDERPQSRDLSVGDPFDHAERRAEEIASGAEPPPSPRTTAKTIIRRALSGSTVGGILGGITAAGLVIGAIAGAAVGAPGIGALIGLGIGAGAALLTWGVAALIEYLTRERHLETKRATTIMRTPGLPGTSGIAQLPEGTRLVREPAPANSPIVSGWAYVRVTTGTYIDIRGWVNEADIERRDNTDVLTLEVAELLWQELQTGEFISTHGTRMQIPFYLPYNGCFARATRMAQLLTEKGYHSRKVFAVSGRSVTPEQIRNMPRGDTGYIDPVNPSQGLVVNTDYAEDRPRGMPPQVGWHYHVAPIVKVRVGREDVDIVIDPSITAGPVTIEAWLRAMSPDRFQQTTLEDFQRVREQPNRPVYFTTGSGQHTPETEVPSEEALRGELTSFAEAAPARVLARDLRVLLREIPFQVNAAIAAISSRPLNVRQMFERAYPTLWNDVLTAAGPVEAPRLVAALRAPGARP